MNGQLKHWNDDRGFGFLKSSGESEDIYIHISALKSAKRRPFQGDTINFEIYIDNLGKKKAVNASIQGVDTVVRKTVKKKKSKSKVGSFLYSLISLTIFLAIGYYFFNSTLRTHIPKENSTYRAFSSIENEVINDKSFKCTGKVYCSQMTSCQEAQFYLRYCPNTKMDGDGDGRPCESQWCN